MHDRSPFGTGIGGDRVIVGYLRRIVEGHLQPGISGNHEDFGYLTVHRPDPGCVDQDQALDVVMVHGRHLSSDPSADGMPD